MKINVNYDLDMQSMYDSISSTNKIESDDLYYKADPSLKTADRIELLEKAVNLNPFNGDAKLELARITCEGEQLEQQLLTLIKEEKVFLEICENVDFERDAGHFWMMFETRPFIRMNYALYELYSSTNQLAKAIKILEMIWKLNSSDNLGIRFILHKELLRAGKYNKIRNFFSVIYYDWCEELGIPYSFDDCQSYSMLVVSARYKNPNNFKMYLKLLDDKSASYILGEKNDSNLLDDELNSFISYTNSEIDNFSMIREYYNQVK